MPRFAPVRQIRRVRFHKHITQDRLSVNGARNAIKRWAAEQSPELASCGFCGVVGASWRVVVEMQTAGRLGRLTKIFAVKALAFLFKVSAHQRRGG